MPEAADTVFTFRTLSAARMSLSFHHFLHEHGTGANDRFEQFVVATVKSVRPSAQPIRANPGDWAIDAYVGSLASGQVAIWQAKFFLLEFGESQKGQIRESFSRALESAAAGQYAVLSWTLCIPEDLDGPAQQWWDTWSAKQHKTHGVEMRLWNLSEFRALMAKPDAADVRSEYFPHLSAVHAPQAPAIAAVPEGDDLDEMLFVRQLREAGMVEVGSAKEQFYNAELVSRDLADKGLTNRHAAFAGLRADLRSTWEDRFNHHLAVSSDGHLLPGLHPDVMDRIDQHHDRAPTEPFPLTKTHRKGALHQVVDAGDAGWVRNFRDIAKEHRGD